MISHSIGASGILNLKVVDGTVSVRGADTTEAQVSARYARQGGNGTDDPLTDGAVRVTRLDGELRLAVEDDDLGLGLGLALGRLVGRGRPAIDFEVSVPHGATVRLVGVSAEMAVADVRAATEIRTVSGDLSLSDVGGRVTLQSVSGDVHLRGAAGSTVGLDATTTSGDLDASADRLEGVRVRSVSGDIALRGALAPEVRHSVESVSGDLELTPGNGVRLTMSSLSGSLRGDMPAGAGGGRGRGSAVVGDGAAELSFRSLSGDLIIVDASRPPVPRPTSGGAMTQSPGEELAILQALERGEIDVEAAARLLEGAKAHA